MASKTANHISRLIEFLKRAIRLVVGLGPSLPLWSASSASPSDSPIEQYIHAVRERHALGFYRPRVFRTSQEWSKWAASHLRSRSFFEQEPTLTDILACRHAVMLGEPGSGKSTEAHAAVLEAADRGWIPVFAYLRGYRGALEQSLELSPPKSDRATYLYVLDGLDEVNDQLLPTLAADIESIANRTNSRVLLTARQAFYWPRSQYFRHFTTVFNILDLTELDIDAWLAHAGIDVREFRRAAAAAAVSDELGNPFALSVFVDMFRETNALPQSKSDAVKHVIDRLLETRPTSMREKQRRALRMLAVAMETAARNELTPDEAQRVLEVALRLSAPEAERLLKELEESILVRTGPAGYAFQLRSYGEYLAAEELRDVQDRARFLPLMYLTGRQIPSDSWRNCVSYLAEVHPAARRWFIRRFPDWVLASAPTTFTDTDKRNVVANVVKTLADSGTILVHHPTIRISQLARFIQPENIADLRVRYTNVDDVDSSNALLLLAAHGDRSVAGEALRIALDPNRSVHVRFSALVAVERVGSSAMVTQLLSVTDWSEPTTSSRLEAATALAGPSQFYDLFEALTKTTVTISGVYQRLHDLESSDEVTAALEALSRLPPQMVADRLSIYCAALWHSVIRLWNADWASSVARLLVTGGSNHFVHSLSDQLIKDLRTVPAIARAVGAAALDYMSSHPVDLFDLRRQIFTIIDADIAVACTEGADPNVIRMLRTFGRPEVRLALSPDGGEEAPAHPRVEAWEARSSEKAERERSDVSAATADDISMQERLNALWRLQQDKWPDLPSIVRDALAAEAQRALAGIDYSKQIVWHTDSSWSAPAHLPFFLQLLNRYELTLTDDTVLISALRASYYSEVARYFERVKISDSAQALLEAQLGDPSLPGGALDGTVRVVSPNVCRSSPKLLQALEGVAAGGRALEIRRAALWAIKQLDSGGDSIRRLDGSVSPELQKEIELELIDLQDRPTISRRLARLLTDPSQLASGERNEPFDNPLSWIRHVRDNAHWGTLVTLRQRALQQQLAIVAGILTDTLAGIDGIRLADLMETQLQYAPAEWRAAQRIHALRYRQEATTKAAQMSPFEEVLQRLRRATTIRLFKIWAEGPKDIPAFERLVEKFPAEIAQDIAVQSVGGWAQVLADAWQPGFMSDGCDDHIVILDGDRARDWGKPNHPVMWSTDVGKALKKLERADIEYRILERYAVENYFPQRAFEAVVGVDLSASFPLLVDQPVESQLPAFKKTMNGDIAAASDLSDFAGTDFGKVLEEVRDRAGD